jgi:recombination protein RecT
MNQTANPPNSQLAKQGAAPAGHISKFRMQGDAALANGKNMAAMLDDMKDQLAAQLPKHVSVARIMKAALTAAIKTPNLLKCSQISFWDSMMRAASLGLDVSGTLGSAYLVPYGTTCTLIIGYRGLIDLARRSNEIASIEAHVIYEQDKFEIQFGTDPKCVHTPYLGADRVDKYVGAYAVAKLRDGSKQVEFMTLADLEKIRAGSRMGNTGAWKDHRSEMYRKTVVRRIVKFLPMSTELEKALEIDNETDGYDDVTPIDVRAIDNANRTESLAGRLTGHTDPQAAPAATVEAELPAAPPPTSTDDLPEAPPISDAEAADIAAREATEAGA